MVFCYHSPSSLIQRDRVKGNIKFIGYIYYFYFFLTLGLLNSNHLDNIYGNFPLYLYIYQIILVFLTVFASFILMFIQAYNLLINFAFHNCIISLFILLMLLILFRVFNFTLINYGLTLTLTLCFLCAFFLTKFIFKTSFPLFCFKCFL